MRVLLKIMGKRLLEAVAKEIAKSESAFPRQFGTSSSIQWHIEALTGPFHSGLLENNAERSAVVLVEAHDISTIEQLWSVQSREYFANAEADRSDDLLAPVILVFNQILPLSAFIELPAVIFDWVNGLDAMQDLARRVYASLKRQKHLFMRADSSHLVLAAESRRLCYAGDAILLTPSEVSIAELFLARLGSVIPMEEIQLLFKLAGRSTEGSNVRVTMFQLRFKVEALTHCQFTLTSAYAEGYVLRHSKSNDTSTMPHAEPALQVTSAGG